ncbi:MAG: cupin domain-containing protein [gamma proteobacterium symbiont of Ctena orbiculata]|nr:cupin domain-containing protein [Candidatus Thiodiazotropha taylori]MBT3063766.1 cupin domain-containing protein [Candidatus Thiodiazotropha sp. (ex Lucina pensylvanica)]PUB73785.1 MAG: cupin domain-containing protein [gamma proteobacterium symbiont of Ctena orbiculata]PUB77560.1 MAG: cupin domain-containing protein [gamma proteobacterium symbiont of Ctena orbiculata]
MQQLHFPNGLTAEKFLADYWQRKPLLFHNPLPEFRCGLEADELAGMACEETVESRLVLEKHGAAPWEARHGPFDEAIFAALPDSHWTLLVQDVDKHLPEVAKLLDHFRFIPDWRLDDVMVSYAVDQGSVGPHIDDYDVFLYQAKGRRRWKIHTRPVAEEDFIPGLDLRILPNFEAEQEWLLGPGDMLYLPPNVAHWGIAEGECMTCSVGFRAPTLHEMAMAWFETALAERMPRQRYRDPPLKPQPAPGEILPNSLDEFKLLLHECLTHSDQTDRWFGRFVTEAKELLQIYPRTEPLSDNQFLNRFRERAVIQRHDYARMAFSRHQEDGHDSLYVNGQDYRLPSDTGDFLPVITHYRILHFGYLQEWLEQPLYLSLLCRLYNDGYLRFADDTE